ncbi:tripartite tricarboxylate transporter substrate binding protein [Roseomonas sp. AR75]|uniref:Bug family tripartite tricarboxylate transporter substrate binding protein n=1 Tax=Roseomonas sp. AR75 TaxID=2562311 RepID=UPI0010BFB2C5|nr:tripartite tricarboxylate transporter substrate-binding protein [Roseomonas sp. AR75]
MLRRHFTTLALGALATPALAQGATAWPTRPVRFVAPTAAGGALDMVARLLAQKLSDQFGQSFLVENRGGAAGVPGMDTVAKAQPDGYTLLFAAAPIALNTALGMRLPYDVGRDFAPVSLVASIPALAVVHPTRPERSLADVIAAGKTPAGFNMAVPNVGAVTHLMAEVLRAKSGPGFTVVAYRGAGQAIQDALSGNVHGFYDALVPTGAHVVGGRMRGIAIGSRQRHPMLPDVATVIEQGMPELLGSGFYGILAPAGTDPAIQRKLHAGIVAAMGDGTELRTRLIAQGYEVHASTPEEYTAFIQNEITRWTPVVRAAGIKVE